MENFKDRQHYVVKDGKLIQLDLSEINEGDPTLYITSTLTSPLVFEFIFGYKKNGDFDWKNADYLYDEKYFFDNNAKNKLCEMVK